MLLQSLVTDQVRCAGHQLGAGTVLSTKESRSGGIKGQSQGGRAEAEESDNDGHLRTRHKMYSSTYHAAAHIVDTVGSSIHFQMCAFITLYHDESYMLREVILPHTNR